MSEVGRSGDPHDGNWRHVSTPAYYAATAGVLIVCYFANTGERWVHLLDSANLALHEAGHPLFGLLFGENFWNIARYMADARARVLPLVGGGEHDWTEIFLRWGALPRDTGIAGFVVFLGWTGILVAWGWLTWRWWQDREMA